VVPIETQLVSGYDLTAAGIRVLSEELYKVKDILPRVDIQRIFSDPSSQALAGNISRACDRAGINCQIGGGRPNSPSEVGVLIYVADPHDVPNAAKTLQSVLEHVGIHASLVSRQGVGSNEFILFVGPIP
jgi:hypothetical protein